MGIARGDTWGLIECRSSWTLEFVLASNSRKKLYLSPWMQASLSERSLQLLFERSWRWDILLAMWLRRTPACPAMGSIVNGGGVFWETWPLVALRHDCNQQTMHQRINGFQGQVRLKMGFCIREHQNTKFPSCGSSRSGLKVFTKTPLKHSKRQRGPSFYLQTGTSFCFCSPTLVEALLRLQTCREFALDELCLWTWRLEVVQHGPWKIRILWTRYRLNCIFSGTVFSCISFKNCFLQVRKPIEIQDVTIWYNLSLGLQHHLDCCLKAILILNMSAFQNGRCRII